MEMYIKNNKLFIKTTKEYDLSGCLDLKGTGITSLPDNLSVGGSLYLRGTGIRKKDIPKTVKVKGNIYTD